MPSSSAFPQYSTPQDLLGLIDSKKKHNHLAGSFDSEDVQEKSDLENELELRELLNFHCNAQIRYNEITLQVPELDITVKHKDSKQAKKIINELVFVEVRRKFYHSSDSLEQEMFLLVGKMELPVNHNSYQWQADRMLQIYPSKETVEYILGTNWPEINRIIKFIND